MGEPANTSTISWALNNRSLSPSVSFWQPSRRNKSPTAPPSLTHLAALLAPSGSSRYPPGAPAIFTIPFTTGYTGEKLLWKRLCRLTQRRERQELISAGGTEPSPLFHCLVETLSWTNAGKAVAKLYDNRTQVTRQKQSPLTPETRHTQTKKRTTKALRCLLNSGKPPRGNRAHHFSILCLSALFNYFW